MAEFIALPVGQGDAFYLKRGDLSILVDGGKSELGFPGLFKNYTLKDNVDIIVCTHNDSDHVNGVIGFLRQRLTCKEIWLPGVWADVLPYALKSFPEKFREVYKSLDEDGHPTLDELVEAIENDELHSEGLLEDQDAEEVTVISSEQDYVPWYSGLEELLEEASDSVEVPRSYGLNFEYIDYYFYSDYHLNHILPYLAATDRIKEIALLAYHAGITVRWFEYDTKNPKGGIPELVPLNSRELIKIRKRKIEKITHYIALSVANKRSLVFLSPADNEAPDVLFNADSDLSGVQSAKLANNCIATAPHHGSASNRWVYGYVESWMGGSPYLLNWIRSDGAFSTRPCPAFINTKGSRYCTLCNASSTKALQPKQAVRFTGTPTNWVASPSVRPCTCR